MTRTPLWRLPLTSWPHYAMPHPARAWALAYLGFVMAFSGLFAAMTLAGRP